MRKLNLSEVMEFEQGHKINEWGSRCLNHSSLPQHCATDGLRQCLSVCRTDKWFILRIHKEFLGFPGGTHGQESATVRPEIYQFNLGQRKSILLDAQSGSVNWNQVYVTPGIEPRSPAFQADSLLSELPGKPICTRSHLNLPPVQAATYHNQSLLCCTLGPCWLSVLNRTDSMGHCHLTLPSWHSSLSLQFIH